MKKIADTSGQDVVRQPTKKRLNWKLLGAASALVALVIVSVPMISSWSQAEASIAGSDVRIATVTRGDFVRDVSIQGRIVAAVSPTLYAPAEGIVTYHVDAGDEVTKDQLLARIDSPELANQLQQEQATLDGLRMNLDRQRIQTKKEALANQKQVDLAKVTLTAAEREKRRADQAWESQAISQIDLEKAHDDLENAKLVYLHAVEDAKLNAESLDFDVQALQLDVNRQEYLVRELQRQVDGLEIRSPVSGIVGNREVDQKNQVAKNQAILSVVDLTAFEVEIGIPESYADDLAIGMTAEIDYNGVKHPATLIAISPEIRNNEVIGTVRFADAMPAGLRQNQRLTTRILLEHKENVLTVERGPFLQTEGGRVVYLVNGDIATKTPVVVGASSLNSVEFIDGVQAGDQIIVSNTERFRGATTVKINR